MGVRTREEYIESLRKAEPNVYLDGEKVTGIVEHPAFQVNLNSGDQFDDDDNPAGSLQVLQNTVEGGAIR